jgi:hypothetical protein
MRNRIIDRVAQSHNIADVKTASDILKFWVYKHVLIEVEQILRAEDIARASLLEVKTALNDVHNGFLDLSARPNKVNKRNINAVIPKLEDADAHLQFAIKGKTIEHLRALRACKRLIFEINQRLA